MSSAAKRTIPAGGLLLLLLACPTSSSALSLDTTRSVEALLFVPGTRADGLPLCRIVSLPSAERGLIPIAGDVLSLRAKAYRPLKSVVFEFRPLGGASWQTCPDPGFGSRPDQRLRLSQAWDISRLEAGAYELRAVATDEGGTPDPDPEVVCIDRVDRAMASEEWFQEASRTWTSRRRATPGRADTITLLDGTSLHLPEGAFTSGDTTWLRIVILPALDPADAVPSPGLVVPSGGSFRRFEREDGTCTFSSAVTLGIPYDDRGLTVPEHGLGIYRFDPVDRAWIRETNTWLDQDENIAWARVDHFTSFAVLGAVPAVSLSGVVVYPNPYVPTDADPANGRPYAAGDPGSGVSFGSVTDDVEITVFTIAGQRVARMQASRTGGTVRWDARNDAGRELASGVYLVVFRAPRGEVVVRKLMIIR